MIHLLMKSNTQHKWRRLASLPDGPENEHALSRVKASRAAAEPNNLFRVVPDGLLTNYRLLPEGSRMEGQ